MLALLFSFSRWSGRKDASTTSTDLQVGGGLSHESHPPNFSALLDLPALCLLGPHPCGIPSGFPRKHLAGSPNPASFLGPPGHYTPHRPVAAPTPQNCSGPSPHRPAQTHTSCTGQPASLPVILGTYSPSLPSPCTTAVWLAACCKSFA